MAKTNILQTAAVAELDGVEVPANHAPETYKLIKSAKQELSDWHAQWGKKPEKDRKAEETAARLYEENTDLIKQFRVPDKFTNEKERVRNLMHVNVFCKKLKKILGPERIHINIPPPVAGFDNNKMRGLFIRMRGMDNFIFHEDLNPGWKKICAIQGPYMPEWGIMLRDDHGGARGFKYIGWRGQVLLRLILAGAITKAEAHTEFGEPQGVDVDREYFKILKEWEENGKRTN